ncbi:GTPase-associated system all-helical protein GASH [Deinococcus gobiensis]|nr:GTPase-associated system all-helical protein GASH [Deinococcus gobiensis]
MNAITGANFDDTHDQAVEPAFKLIIERLTNEPESLIDAALAAFLPHSTKEHPLLKETFNDIESIWPYVRKKFADEPIWLDRYVLGRALLEIADTNSIAAAKMYLALKDPFLYTLETREANFRTSFLKVWKPSFEKVAKMFWQPSEDFSPVPVKSITAQISTESINTLKAQLQEATEGTAFQDANGEAYDMDKDWITTFSAVAGDAISASINEALKELTQKLPSQLRSASNYHERIQEILKYATRAQRQGNLTWWLLSKYSVPTDQSYRALSPLSGVLQMVLDFKQFASTLAPSEVDAILLEAIWTTYPDSMAEERTINEWIDDVITCKESAEYGVSDRKISPLLLCDVIAAKHNGSLVEAATLAGVNSEVKLTLANFAIWLWHSTQAHSS